MDTPSGDNPEIESKEAANEVMTPAVRLEQMVNRHRLLDDKITEMHSFPFQNHILMQRLKKEKLYLKDAIERLKDELIPDLNA